MDLIVAMALTLAGPPSGLAHVNPIGRLVRSTPEAVLLDEGLQQVKAMAVAPLPIGIDALSDLAENMISQLCYSDPRQDQIATVVGDERQTPSTLLG
jgi:hypothetical protein